MFNEDEQHVNRNDSEFEVSFTKESKKKKKTDSSSDLRVPFEQIKPKIDVYQECRTMFEHLRDSYIKQDELVVVLPEQLQAKYILKSITYLADEWITLRSSYIKQGDTNNKIIIDINQLSEDQIANMCSELNECIDHFIARATDS